MIAKLQRFILGGVIHSSFLIAHDESHLPASLTLDNRRYTFIFTDEDEFRKAFSADDISSRKFELKTLRDILKAWVGCLYAECLFP